MLSNRRYSNLFALWVFQGMIALVWLLIIPTDSGTYSAARLSLIGLTLSLTIGSAVLAYRSRSKDWQVLPFDSWLYKFFYFLALLAFFLSPLVISVLSALGRDLGFRYTAYAQRLTPLAFWSSLSGLEWCLWHILGRNIDFLHFRQILRSTLKFLVLCLIALVIISCTGWGTFPIRDGSFGSPPTPLLEWQIGLAVVLGAVALLTEPNWKMKRLDLALFLCVYLFACLLWLSDPLVPGFFATPPRAPNFEPYPFSDPLIYAQYSQSALVGEGFLWPDIPTRPFYIMLLTWMHAIMGQNYDRVIALQTVLLAFFPAALYLLGRELGSRPAGLMLALLAILRDLTTNRAAPFAFNYSYSKLFLSELPTALLLVIFTIFVIKWIKSPKQRWFFLMVGGVLGVATLTRLQSAVLLIPVAIVTAFPLWKTRRLEWLQGLLLITLGLSLAFAPWLVRNYGAAEGLVFDNPISQSMVFARRWSGDNGNTLLAQFPGETTAGYVSRMNRIALDSFKREPGRILNGIAHHFVNNLVSSLHTLPIRDRLNSAGELLWPAHAFWQTGARSAWLSASYVILLSLGLGVAWTFQRWIGLLPFSLSVGYNAWTAIFLSSGDRFLLPIDWTWHLYYVLALLALLKMAFSGIDKVRPWAFALQETNSFESKPSWRRTILTAALVLGIGTLLPATELVFPEKYPALPQEQLASTLSLVPTLGETIVYGRAVYPRYYETGKGEPETAKLGYGPTDEARLVFWLVGPRPGLVIFPLETAPKFFPHASDVWIVGTLDGNTMHARIIEVRAGERTAIYGECPICKQGSGS